MRRLIQDVKVKGLPGGEAHRIDSYITMIGVGFDRLCAIKEYRTPRAFRAFARVNILLVRAVPMHSTIPRMCTACAPHVHRMCTACALHVPHMCPAFRWAQCTGQTTSCWHAPMTATSQTSMLRAATFFVVPQVGSSASSDGPALLWVALRTPEESPRR